MAIKQAELVKAGIIKHYPEFESTIILVPLTTTGDDLIDQSLALVGGKGLFIKEIEKALLTHTADIAVHSAKDLPADYTPGLEMTAFMEREDPRDVFLSSLYSHLSDLPSGAIIGTSSPRRENMIKSMRPDLTVKLLRGNVLTRIHKMESGHYDGIILAAAGLHRLNLTHLIKQYFSLEESIPAVGQGIIAVQTRQDDVLIQNIITKLDHPITRACILAERAVNKVLGGNCHMPIGAHAQYDVSHQILSLTACMADKKKHGQDTLENAEILGQTVAKKLLDE